MLCSSFVEVRNNIGLTDNDIDRLIMIDTSPQDKWSDDNNENKMLQNHKPRNVMQICNGYRQFAVRCGFVYRQNILTIILNLEQETIWL